MMDPELATLIGSYGFPIATAAYLMWERTNVMGKLTDSLNANTAMLQSLRDTMKRD